MFEKSDKRGSTVPRSLYRLFRFLPFSKRPKSGGSVSSVGTGYREKSPVPSALSPTPQVLGASILEDTLDGPRERRLGSNDIDNPVFGGDNEGPYNATIKSKHTQM